MIRRRIADLAAFDVVRYAQKACSNLAILDLVRRDGVLVDTVSAGEIRRALAAGYAPAGDPPPIVYTADIFDAESLDAVRGTEHPRQLRLARHDRPVRPPRTGARNHACASIPASATATARRPTPAASRRSTAFGTARLPSASQRAEQLRLARHRPAHAHRLGHRPGTSFAGMRGDGKSGRRGRPARSRRSAPAAACRPSIARPTRYVDLDAYFALWDATRRRLEDRFGAPRAAGDRAGRVIWWPKAATCVAEIRAVKRQDDNTFYLLDAGFNNLARPILYGAYHPMSVVPSDGDTAAARAGRDRRRPAVRIGRHLHAGRGRLRRAPAGCPRPRSANCW